MNNRWSKIKKIAAYILSQRNHYTQMVDKSSQAGNDRLVNSALRNKCNQLMRYICFLEPSIQRFAEEHIEPDDPVLEDRNYTQKLKHGYRVLGNKGDKEAQ